MKKASSNNQLLEACNILVSSRIGYLNIDTDPFFTSVPSP